MRAQIRLLMAIGLVGAALVVSAADAEAPLVLEIKDYATAPMTGSTTGTGNGGSLARINMLREEPGGAGRFFVNDLNGPLYILDRKTKAFTTYLDFNGRDKRPGFLTSCRSTPGSPTGSSPFSSTPTTDATGSSTPSTSKNRRRRVRSFPTRRVSPG